MSQIFAFVFLLMGLSNQAVATDCAQSLKTVLKTAKNQVVANFEKDSPCYNAALIGRKNGPPGCFPPEVFTLQNLLSPYLDKAIAVCKQVCDEEGLKDQCLDITQQSYLRQKGIEGLLQVLDSAQFNP